MFSAATELGMPSQPLITAPPRFQMVLMVFSLTVACPFRSLKQTRCGLLPHGAERRIIRQNAGTEQRGFWRRHSMGIDRRRFLSASAAAMAAPYVRTSYAAGSLAVGFWDHWVPGANDTLTKLCNEWAAKEKVDLKIDYITSQGNKLLLTVTS